MTPHNLQQNLSRARAAGAAAVVDPGSGGTINFVPNDLCVVTLTGAGARTLQAAARVPLGTRILCLSQTNAVTVNSNTIDDGEHLYFVVTLDSSGAHQWVAETSLAQQDELNTIETYLERAKTVNVSMLEFRVHDAPATFLSAGAGSSDDLGLIIGTFGTTAPELSADVDDTSATQYGRVQVRVPNDYVDGTALTLEAVVTENAAADTSATLDAEVYRTADPSTDLVTTAAQDITGTTSQSITFSLTGTNVVRGELLDVRLAAIIDDSAGTSATAVYRIEEVNLQYATVVIA